MEADVCCCGGSRADNALDREKNRAREKLVKLGKRLGIEDIVGSWKECRT
jgi:hypothetical protein